AVLLACLSAAFLAGCTSATDTPGDRPSAVVLTITATPAVTTSPDPDTEARNYSRDGFALWPEDTYEAALAATQNGGGSAWRNDPKETAARFASDVLGWKRAVVEIARSKDTSAAAVVSQGTSGDPVDLSLRAGIPGSWSVLNVLPHGEYFPSVSVQNGRASIGVELDGDAASAEVTVGYGGRDRSVRTTRAGIVRIDLGYEANTSGHFLILFRDAGGETVSAVGTTLPAGDFAAS
ncbi:MAG: hypothetical protein M3O88_07315, partial [Actinomycetota bacterium]|nr:hypothetical protein [Actinomycetota bacterium]